MSTSLQAPSLTLTFTLACGCTINQTFNDEQPIQADDTMCVFMDSGAHALEFWTKNRIDRHRCHLVDESNPNGIVPGHDPIP